MKKLRDVIPLDHHRHDHDLDYAKAERFVDGDGFTAEVAPVKANSNLGAYGRAGVKFIYNPQGRKVMSHYWANRPEEGWTHQGENLYDDTRDDRATSAWNRLPLSDRLRREAVQQATAYKPLKSQFKDLDK